MKDPKVDPVWESLRLPNNTVPIHYDIALTIDLHGRKFSGTADTRLSYVNVSN